MSVHKLFQIDSISSEDPPLVVTRGEFEYLVDKKAVIISPVKGRKGVLTLLAEYHAHQPQVAAVAGPDPVILPQEQGVH